jgi:putative Mn2+ efflux pump MntP
VAFGLLALIGGNMVYEALTRDACEPRVAPVGWAALLTLSVATSIDALAVGLSLSFLNVAIGAPAAIFGLVTVVVSLAGLALGRRAGGLLHDKVQLVGGLILIGIGVKIVIEHLVPAATAML